MDRLIITPGSETSLSGSMLSAVTVTAARLAVPSLISVMSTAAGAAAFQQVGMFMADNRVYSNGSGLTIEPGVSSMRGWSYNGPAVDQLQSPGISSFDADWVMSPPEIPLRGGVLGDKVRSGTAPWGRAFTEILLTAAGPEIIVGKVFASGITSIFRISRAAKGGSILADASKASFNAADDVGSIFIKNKHLSTATGNYAKFATTEVSTARGWVQQALRSPNARFLPNPQIPNTFQVVTDLGTTIGTKGQTSIRAIVGFDGKVINAFPIK
ncbi:MAG: hypothetical protein K2U26_08315 [Cyclobacteriaceae bacterium]|nr:hypothetical protein [Cyclobacteriaceae bacterium]